MASNFDRPPAYDELYDVSPSTPLITSQPKVQHVNQYYGQPKQLQLQQQLQPRQANVINSSNQSDHHNNRYNDQCDEICCCCCLVCIRCIMWG